MTLSQFLSVTREHYQIALLDNDFRTISEWKPCKFVSFQTEQEIKLLDRQVIDFVIVDCTRILIRVN